MKRYSIILLIVAAFLMILAPTSQAGKVAPEKAREVAQNWLSLVLHEKGDWGFCETPLLKEMEEFKRGDRLLGYFFNVEPNGFIVVSLHEALAPVKACSETSDLDPASEEGLADLIKAGMEGVIDAIEQNVGPIESATRNELEAYLDIDYYPAWSELLGEKGSFENALLTGGKKMNYAEGEILLSSSWHQNPPYNDDCPNMSCSWPNYNNFNQNAVVGCVATAGAQIMRHWNWPPDGQGSSPYSDTYNWTGMLDRYVWSWTPTPWFYDELGNPVTQAEIDAVAELCAEVGQAVGMSYGCGSSGAYTHHMEGVFENTYRYSNSCVRRNRSDYGAVDWFNRLKTQFNANRPVQYRVQGHSIVGDGWREIGSGPLREYHMNYGWDNSNNAWYTLDALHLGGIDEEYILEDIVPVCFLGATLSGTYAKPSFPYRYFDRDAACSGSATFSAGQNLQFLPEVHVTSTSTTGGSIRFLGSSSANTRLFTKGDQTQGAKIVNGAIKLFQNGSIMFPDD